MNISHETKIIKVPTEKFSAGAFHFPRTVPKLKAVCESAALLGFLFTGEKNV